MINCSKRLIVATFATASLLCGLANVQASQRMIQPKPSASSLATEAPTEADEEKLTTTESTETKKGIPVTTPLWYGDMMLQYLQLPPGRKKGSSRTRMLTAIRKKAAKMVTHMSKNDEDFKKIFACMPEGWFKMEIRHAYFKHHNRSYDMICKIPKTPEVDKLRETFRSERKYIDPVPIDFIMEQINTESGHVNFRNTILGVPLKTITDLSILANEKHPIISLNISGCRVYGLMPSYIDQLTKLIELYVQSNRLAGPLPKTMLNLTKLKTLEISADSCNLSSDDRQLLGSLYTKYGTLVFLNY